MIHKLSDVQSKRIGENTKVWQFCVILEGAEIGKNCNINCNVFIENEVIIGNNCTIKSGVQIWDGITIENNVFIGPNVTFTNDIYPRSKDYSKAFCKTTVQHNASIGANSTILPNVTIGEFVIVGAGTLVNKNLPKNTIWIGNPAKMIGYITNFNEKLDLNLISVIRGIQFKWKNNQLVEAL